MTEETAERFPLFTTDMAHSGQQQGFVLRMETD